MGRRCGDRQPVLRASGRRHIHERARVALCDHPQYRPAALGAAGRERAGERAHRRARLRHRRVVDRDVRDGIGGAQVLHRERVVDILAHHRRLSRSRLGQQQVAGDQPDLRSRRVLHRHAGRGGRGAPHRRDVAQRVEVARPHRVLVDEPYLVVAAAGYSIIGGQAVVRHRPGDAERRGEQRIPHLQVLDGHHTQVAHADEVRDHIRRVGVARVDCGDTASHAGVIGQVADTGILLDAHFRVLDVNHRLRHVDGLLARLVIDAAHGHPVDVRVCIRRQDGIGVIERIGLVGVQCLRAAGRRRREPGSHDQRIAVVVPIQIRRVNPLVREDHAVERHRADVRYRHGVADRRAHRNQRGVGRLGHQDAGFAHVDRGRRAVRHRDTARHAVNLNHVPILRALETNRYRHRDPTD